MTDEHMTLEAIQQDPWASVQLALPPNASRDLLVAAAAAARACEAEAREVVRNHDREDADSVGYAAEMHFMAQQASQRINEISDLMSERAEQQRFERDPRRLQTHGRRL